MLIARKLTMELSGSSLRERIEVLGTTGAGYSEIVTPEALAFVARLARQFENRRRELLADRTRRQHEFDAGKLPDFLKETAAIRSGAWTIGAVPRDLQERRVEITGPTNRKMIIGALNCGA